MKKYRSLINRSIEWMWSWSARAGLVAVLAAIAVPAARGQVRMSAGTARGIAGAVVTIPLTFNSQSNIVAFQADIVHDPGALTTSGALPGAAAGGAMLLSSVPQPGTRRLLLYSPTGGAMSNGSVAEITFVVAPNIYSGSYRLTLTNVIVATAAAQPLVSTNDAGLIALSPVYLRVDGGVDFVLNVTANQTYLVQASSNLVDWLTLSTNMAVRPYLELTDPGAATVYRQRFYRALPAGP